MKNKFLNKFVTENINAQIPQPEFSATKQSEEFIPIENPDFETEDNYNNTYENNKTNEDNENNDKIKEILHTTGNIPEKVTDNSKSKVHTTY